MEAALEESVLGIEVRRALLEAIAQSDLHISDKRRLRRAMRFNPVMARKMIEATTAESQDENMIASTGEILVDWDGLIKFFKEVILPLLLQLFLT